MTTQVIPSLEWGIRQQQTGHSGTVCERPRHKPSSGYLVDRSRPTTHDCSQSPLCTEHTSYTATSESRTDWCDF